MLMHLTPKNKVGEHCEGVDIGCMIGNSSNPQQDP
jgi:hypothetical protein